MIPDVAQVRGVLLKPVKALEQKQFASEQTEKKRKKKKEKRLGVRTRVV